MKLVDKTSQQYRLQLCTSGVDTAHRYEAVCMPDDRYFVQLSVRPWTSVLTPPGRVAEVKVVLIQRSMFRQSATLHALLMR